MNSYHENQSSLPNAAKGFPPLYLEKMKKNFNKRTLAHTKKKRLLCVGAERQTSGMLEKAEREAKEAATAVSVARSRSTSHAARYSLPVGNNGGGYTRLLDDPEAGEQLSVADPAVSCTGVPPAEARDGDSLALTADQVSDPLGLLGRGEETEFSIAPASRQPYLSGKSDIHWIPMIDIVGGTKRVNLRFLLVSQRLHARVVCRLPLVLVLWFLLILLETAAFFVWAPPPPPPPPPGEEPRLSARRAIS